MDSSENAAFTMLHESSEGKDISNRYNSLSLPEQRQVLSSMRQVQSDMMAKFGNVELIDSDRDGILDNAKARVTDQSGQAVVKDVYNPLASDRQARNEAARGIEIEAHPQIRPTHMDTNLRQTPVEQRMDRVENHAIDGTARAGQIVLDEALRGVWRGGRGPSTGERIQRRLGNEAVRNSNNILRDILH